MSSGYADSKMVEALCMTGGSLQAARKLVVNWAGHDERLLKELAEPFLTGIVRNALERNLSTMPRPRPEMATLSKSALDGLIRAMGENFARSGVVPGFAPQRVERPQLSRRQADAIRMLADLHIGRQPAA